MLRKFIPILLFLPLTSCSGADVIVKSDLGEEYLVKNDAVYVQPYDKKAPLLAATSNVTTTYGSYQNCLNTLDNDTCTRIYLGQSYEEQLRLMRYLEAFDPSNLRVIKYRQIYTDLNGKKTPSDYLYLTCLNPRLSRSDKESIEENLDFKQPIDAGSSVDRLQSRICERWAKFT